MQSYYVYTFCTEFVEITIIFETLKWTPKLNSSTNICQQQIINFWGTCMAVKQWSCWYVIDVNSNKADITDDDRLH